jgi:hypothetical protein
LENTVNATRCCGAAARKAAVSFGSSDATLTQTLSMAPLNRSSVDDSSLSSFSPPKKNACRLENFIVSCGTARGAR